MKSSNQKFDPSEIEKRINELPKLGFIVKKEDTNDRYGRRIYWKIGLIDGINHTGIGYNFPEEGKSDYFYHNSHSGNINNPDNSIGSTWNNHNEKPGPGGWYTFDNVYVHGVINRLRQNANKK